MLVPRGKVAAYGDVTPGAPRHAGRVLSESHEPDVPWWRVVRADGSLPPSHHSEALARYLDEGTPRTAAGRVDLGASFWMPTRE